MANPDRPCKACLQNGDGHMVAERILKGQSSPATKSPPSSRISPMKAAEMLDNPPGGRPLTDKQRGLFGAIASGKSRKKGY